MDIGHNQTIPASWPEPPDRTLWAIDFVEIYLALFCSFRTIIIYSAKNLQVDEPTQNKLINTRDACLRDCLKRIKR